MNCAHKVHDSALNWFERIARIAWTPNKEINLRGKRTLLVRHRA